MFTVKPVSIVIVKYDYVLCYTVFMHTCLCWALTTIKLSNHLFWLSGHMVWNESFLCCYLNWLAMAWCYYASSWAFHCICTQYAHIQIPAHRNSLSIKIITIRSCTISQSKPSLSFLQLSLRGGAQTMECGGAVLTAVMCVVWRNPFISVWQLSCSNSFKFKCFNIQIDLLQTNRC